MDKVKSIDSLRFRTPSTTFNILSNGGFRARSLVELWGETMSGKSTFAYGVAKHAREDLGAAVVILDVELSTDPIRMKRAFGLREAQAVEVGEDETNIYYVTRTGLTAVDKEDKKQLKELAEKAQGGDYVIVSLPFLERGLAFLKEVASKATRPTVVIYDSITVHATESSLKGNGMYAGGQAEKPRILKHYLAVLMTTMFVESSPVLALLINQVHTDIGSFRPTLTSGGGHGLKHDIHYSLKFTKRSSVEAGNQVHYVFSGFKVVKSKFTPKFPPEGTDQWLNLVISEREGGVPIPELSFLRDLQELKVLEQKGGWYKVGDKSYRMQQLLADFPTLSKTLMDLMRDYIHANYSICRWHFEEEGNLIRDFGYNKKTGGKKSHEQG